MDLNKDKIRRETVAKMDEMFEGKIDGQHREAMIKGINEVLDELDTLSEKHSANSSMSLADLLSHLPQERIDLIRHSFDILTFYPSVDSKSKTCAFLKEGSVVWPTIRLDSEKGLRKAKLTVLASILVEIVIFIMRLLGLSPPDKTIAAAIDVATILLRADEKMVPKLKSLFDGMKQAVRQKDLHKLAELIVQLITTVSAESATVFWKIVKTLLSHMSKFDYVVFAAKLGIFIAVIRRTGGVAFVERLLSLIVESSGFLKKFVDIVV